MWQSPMFWRIFGGYTILLLSVIALLDVVIVRRVENQYLQQVEESLRTKATLLREAFRDFPAEQLSLLQKRIQQLRNDIATRVTLIAEDGRVLADSEEDPLEMENHANRPEVVQAREASVGVTTRFSKTLNQPMMYVALRAAAGSDPVAYVRVALPLDRIQEQSIWLRRVAGSAAGVTAIVGLALALWIARRVTRPLHELTLSAQRIAAGEYGQRVYASGSDEVATLALAFNQMSERLAAQFAQLAEDRQQLRMILSGMVEGVVALDPQQHIVFANDRARQLLELQAAGTGRKLWEVVRWRSLQELVERSFEKAEPCYGELTSTSNPAKTLTVHASPLPGTGPRGAVLVLHDTSELRRLERLRRDFVANVSHELKTPLSVIKACVETLQEGAVDDPLHRDRFLNRIAEQSDRLHALIIDLLSLARIESGTESFVFQPIPIASAVQACVERHRARAEAQQQQLGVVAPQESSTGPLTVWADEDAIDQILENLVDNALKYTPAGGCISVRWQLDGGMAKLEVEDTGIGIPAQDLPRIFERFYRVDKARSRELGGTGLGLSIVKHLVQAMHGTISATSQVGRGTIFCIRMPLADGRSEWQQ